MQSVAVEALPTGLGVACPSIAQSVEGMLEQLSVNNPGSQSSEQHMASFWERRQTQVPLLVAVDPTWQFQTSTNCK